ncbi:MAG: ribosomal protein S18-alanine N-acetyltransferase [Nitrospira sp.]|nr:ribosomal protein S18-alanine N-acetyltransferase [Nitrospira sp.]
MTVDTASSRVCLVRSLVSRDVQDILSIERESFATPWTQAMVEAELQGNPFSRFLGAFSPNGGAQAELLGYLCYWVVFEEVRLMNVAVRPKNRRQGIARHLAQHALQEGQAHGATRALLEVRASNGAACALYQSLGFRQYSRRRAYYTNPNEDAILMHLTEQEHGECSGRTRPFQQQESPHAD